MATIAIAAATIGAQSIAPIALFGNGNVTEGAGATIIDDPSSQVDVPVDDTPVDDTPAEETPATPTEDTPTEDVPTDVPAEDTPTEETPAEVPGETPTEDIPTEVPTEDPPTEDPADTPEEVPAEVPGETPTEDVPTEVPTEDVPGEIPAEDPPAVVPTENPWVTEPWDYEIAEVPAAPITSGVYLIDGTALTSTTGPAIAIQAGEEVTLIIRGTCTVTSTVSDAILVPATSSLTIKGFDEDSTLTVSSDDGSAIGNHSGNTGSITIGRIADLSATANGTHGYAIGGANATVTITRAHISSAIGGELQTYDDSYLGKIVSKYGKTDPEGGCGIGGSTITITDSVIDLVVGGSKAAGIGACFWQATSISIVDSTIGAVYGGGTSAGIGGSREVSDGTAADQIISIYIENSDVTAYGGDYGAGIGSGYDTNCQSVQGECNIVIVSGSRISATGGMYAAGIGTGYHYGHLTGYIDDTVDVTDVHSGNKHYKDSYSDAQDIGYGVISPSKEGVQATGSGLCFTVAGDIIADPFA